MVLAAFSMALALAGPTGLPVLHSTSAEEAQQQVILSRAREREPFEGRERPVADPNSPQAKRAAAWRADHLTCASRKGRSHDEYQRECAAWAAEQAAAEAGR